MKKWCFLVNNAQFLSEFLGKVASIAISNGDKCIVLVNSRIAEYTKPQYFPQKAKIISKVEWCKKNYRSGQKEFGEFSWKDFSPIISRWFPYFKWDFKKAVEATSQLFQFFEYVFKEESPDLVIGEPPAGLFGKVGYYFAKKYNVPFLGITDSRINMALYDTEWTDTRFESTFKDISLQDITQEEKEFINEWIKNFVSHAKKPEYMKYVKASFTPLEFLLHYFKKIPEILPLLRYFFERAHYKQYDYESEAILITSLLTPFMLAKKQIQRFLQKRFFQQIQETDQFFVYPLHFEPEAATLVLAVYYSDQLATIRNIAYSLPFPYKLYVKEHPIFMGSRPDSFYQKLRTIPNVVLVSPFAEVPQLVQKSSGVITLTSTIGLEAVLTGKPAYILGNVFYSYHPLARKVKNFDDLREKIRQDLSGFNQLDKATLDSINFRFLASYIRNTIPGNSAFASEPQDRNDYQAIYKAITSRLQLT